MTAYRTRRPPGLPPLINTLINVRVDADMTQAQLAERLGVSVKAISRWERSGRPPFPMLLAWCEALGLELQLVRAS